MRVIVCCEESQAITIAYRNKGVEAFSCDLKPCSGGHPEWHLQCSALDIDFSCYDLVIAHPPCTYLARSGACNNKRYPQRISLGFEAKEFFMFFYNLRFKYPNLRICIENPIPQAKFGLPGYQQIIQPYNFNEPFSKATCLWLYRLPPLFSTVIVPDYSSYVLQFNGNDKLRSEKRSKTFPGIALAISNQWIFD